MNLQITGRHNMELSKALKARVEKEVSAFERYFENIVSCHLVFEEEKVGVALTLDVKVYGDVLSVSSKGENAFAALELATDKMKRRLKDQKARLKERKRHASPTQEALEQIHPPEAD
jgi:ribosomal subunit interface protein